jgi:hypothetical protein
MKERSFVAVFPLERLGRVVVCGHRAYFAVSYSGAIGQKGESDDLFGLL